MKKNILRSCFIVMVIISMTAVFAACKSRAKKARDEKKSAETKEAVTTTTTPEKKEVVASKTVVATEQATKMEHIMPMPGELCVGCHMETKEPDPESISPKINLEHAVCNHCHKPDGTIEGHCGCEDTDDPMDCQQCHTDPATGTIPSAKVMNDKCLDCH